VTNINLIRKISYVLILAVLIVSYGICFGVSYRTPCGSYTDDPEIVRAISFVLEVVKHVLANIEKPGWWQESEAARTYYGKSQEWGSEDNLNVIRDAFNNFKYRGYYKEFDFTSKKTLLKSYLIKIQETIKDLTVKRADRGKISPAGTYAESETRPDLNWTCIEFFDSFYERQLLPEENNQKTDSQLQILAHEISHALLGLADKPIECEKIKCSSTTATECIECSYGRQPAKDRASNDLAFVCPENFGFFIEAAYIELKNDDQKEKDQKKPDL
jgi:hypothetical protein